MTRTVTSERTMTPGGVLVREGTRGRGRARKAVVPGARKVAAPGGREVVAPGGREVMVPGGRVLARLTGGARDREAGLATAEYAIATVAAAGFAGLLIVVLKSGEVRELLLGIVRSALSLG